MPSRELVYRILRDHAQLAWKARDQLVWRPYLEPPSLALVRFLPPEVMRILIRHPHDLELLRGCPVNPDELVERLRWRRRRGERPDLKIL